LIDPEDAEEAAWHGIYLEISARQGANWANGHVYQVARRARAPLMVDSDAHEEAGLLSGPKVEALLRGAGASVLSAESVRSHMAATFVDKLLRRYATVS
jgi:histidinol phosphatase-like PHP family hydrolase